MILDLPNCGAEFRAARPFPHVVLTRVFSPELLRAAADAVPPADSPLWTQRRNKVVPNKPPKLGIENLKDLPAIEALAASMCSWEFTDWLAEISGIDDLIADTSLAGAGLHGVQRGGSLGIHVDFDRLDALYRRINAFVYLNDGWEDSWGGALELHDDKAAVVVIPPAFGTFVAFETSDHSWHGHPYPLRCPEGRLRASLAVYYYSASRPDWYREDHSTIYRELADQ